jgi:hypothetical protein
MIPEMQDAVGRMGPTAFDFVRRKYITQLAEHTGRNVILYMTNWTRGGVDPGLVSITFEDVQGFMEVVHGLDGEAGLDLIIHSPGGTPDATEAIVHYLRSKFTHIRVFVPQAAMSAATMLACAADEIVMGKHSSLGPIDPQFLVTTASGTSAVPAQAVIDQFELAQEACADPANLGAWAPILPQYGPALLVQCVNALELAEDLAAQWLRTWMFAGVKYGARKARGIARKLADHTKFKSHGRPIHRDAAWKMGLNISNLEDSQELQDRVLSVFHAYMHTFGATTAVKIIENHRGQAFVKFQPVFQGLQLPPIPLPQPASPPNQPLESQPPTGGAGPGHPPR